MTDRTEGANEAERRAIDRMLELGWLERGEDAAEGVPTYKVTGPIDPEQYQREIDPILGPVVYAHAAVALEALAPGASRVRGDSRSPFDHSEEAPAGSDGREYLVVRRDAVFRADGERAQLGDVPQLLTHDETEALLGADMDGPIGSGITTARDLVVVHGHILWMAEDGARGHEIPAEGEGAS